MGCGCSTTVGDHARHKGRAEELYGHPSYRDEYDDATTVATSTATTSQHAQTDQHTINVRSTLLSTRPMTAAEPRYVADDPSSQRTTRSASTPDSNNNSCPSSDIQRNANSSGAGLSSDGGKPSFVLHQSRASSIFASSLSSIVATLPECAFCPMCIQRAKMLPPAQSACVRESGRWWCDADLSSLSAAAAAPAGPAVVIDETALLAAVRFVAVSNPCSITGQLSTDHTRILRTLETQRNNSSMVSTDIEPPPHVGCRDVPSPSDVAPACEPVTEVAPLAAKRDHRRYQDGSRSRSNSSGSAAAVDAADLSIRSDSFNGAAVSCNTPQPHFESTPAMSSTQLAGAPALLWSPVTLNASSTNLATLLPLASIAADDIDDDADRTHHPHRPTTRSTDVPNQKSIWGADQQRMMMSVSALGSSGTAALLLSPPFSPTRDNSTMMLLASASASELMSPIVRPPRTGSGGALWGTAHLLSPKDCARADVPQQQQHNNEKLIALSSTGDDTDADSDQTTFHGGDEVLAAALGYRAELVGCRTVWRRPADAGDGAWLVTKTFDLGAAESELSQAELHARVLRRRDSVGELAEERSGLGARLRKKWREMEAARRVESEGEAMDAEVARHVETVEREHASPAPHHPNERYPGNGPFALRRQVWRWLKKLPPHAPCVGCELEQRSCYQALLRDSSALLEYERLRLQRVGRGENDQLTNEEIASAAIRRQDQLARAADAVTATAPPLALCVRCSCDYARQLHTCCH